VRIATSGLAYTSSDERGLAFGPIRYGNATWIDARGVRTVVRPTWADGVITLRVPADVVRDSVFPATLDPLVAPEIALDQPFLVRAPSTQDHAAAAFNGTSYLVVWDDMRNGGFDVFGARVDPSTGSVLSADAAGIAIATGQGSQQLPAVASNGTDFFVVWGDNRTEPNKIYGARLSGATGQITDANGFALGGGLASQRAPSVAWDGTNYFVVWEDARNASTDIFGVRVAPDGKPLAADDSGIAVGTAASAQTHPRVACDGTQCLVVWSDNPGGLDPPDYDVSGVRVTSATGALVDSAPLAIAVGSGSQSNPSIAYDDVHGNYLVAWDDFVGAGALPDIRGRRLDHTTGASLDATPIAIATGDQAQRGSALAFDGTKFLATWTDAGGPATIFGALLGTDGSRITTAPEGNAIGKPSISESGSTVAGGKPGFYAAWTELSASAPSDVYGTRIDSDLGTPTETERTILSGHANAEMAPAVASDGTDYFVVWEDWRSSAPGDVYGVRVHADGSVPADDQAGVLIATAAPAGSGSGLRHVQPAIAFGGGTYVVAWTDRRPPPPPETGLITSVYALRVDPATGRPAPADGNGIRVSGDAKAEQTAPALAFTGGTFLAAWRDGRNGPENVYARTIKADASGLQLGDEQRIGQGPNASTAPSVAGDGAQTFLIAWEDFRDGLEFLTYAARLDTSGNVVSGDAGGFAVSQIVANQIGPTAAWSGSDFFVAWEDHRSHGAGGEIYGRRIPKSGAPAGDDIPIATGPGIRQTPAIADARDGAPGGNLQVVWSDDRNGQLDIFGSLVSGTGLVREPKGLAIALEPGDKTSPALAARGNGDLLVAYSRFDPVAPFAVARARARTISTGLKSGACTKDDDCATRFCTDGVCCDARCDEPCRTCGSGTCGLVTSGQDDHCNGISSCSATGACIRANGQPCQTSSECASGVCDRDDGVCCDRACDGECNTCKSDKSPGTCTVLIAGTAPVNCLPFACDGKNEQCPTKCEGDIACARPNVCLGDGTCQAITAPTCIDTHTLKAPSGLATDCAPYACSGNGCLQACKSLADCVNGFACDVDGVCRQPSNDDVSGGCSCRTGRASPSGSVAWIALAAAIVRRLTSRKRSRAAGNR
jgi:MYXO-CTERM domain-containing protein